MKTRSNLGNFFGGVILLFFTGLVSIANQYNEMWAMENCCHDYSADHSTRELKHYLKLNEAQVRKLKSIHADFYSKVSIVRENYVRNDKRIDREINQLMIKRNAQVIELLNDHQKELIANSQFLYLTKN